MDIHKIDKALQRLYNYGEVAYSQELVFLQEIGLIQVVDSTAIITNNWIEYGKQFQNGQDVLRSLLCFNREYQQYLLKLALLTVLKMRDAKDLDGLMEFVTKMPKLCEQAVIILKNIAYENHKSFDAAKLEKEVKAVESSFRELDHYIFDGVPQYQRSLYYLEKVQRYQAKESGRLLPLGKTIDQNWDKKRIISADLQLFPLKEAPMIVLTPYEWQGVVYNPLFHNIFTYPWKLFVFMWCVVREHYEAQGTQAIRFRVVEGRVEVLIMSNKNQEFRYGLFNDFALEFCHVNQYQLFPNIQLNVESIFDEFFDRKIVHIVDEEYRLASHIDNEIHSTNIYISLIAKSKQLRQQMQQWVDELRNKP